MMSSKIQKDLFGIFVECGVSDCELFNKIEAKIIDVIKNERGNSDAEFYEILVNLMNNENNSGWDKQDRHSAKIKIINDSMFEIVERSEEFLP